MGTRGYPACLYFLFLNITLKVHKEIVLALLFWLVRSSFYDVLVISFPVGTRKYRACLSFMIGLIFVL